MQYDAVVIGSGPNGLAAAITLAKKSLSVLVIESFHKPGGGMRTAELTLPGFKHDVCSAIHPLGYASPFFQTIPFNELGVEWIFPETPAAHLYSPDETILLNTSFEETASQFGSDTGKYINYIKPLTEIWDDIAPDLLGPLTFPKHPFEALRFGLTAFHSAKGFAKKHFDDERAKALFTGVAAHAMVPLETVLTSSFGIILQVLAHKVNWPFPKGGSASITNALVKYFESLGGKIITNWKITSVEEIPSAKIVLFDLSPKQILDIMGDKLLVKYSNALKRYRGSAGIYKLDLALSEPVPWKNKKCLSTATLHIGGSMEDILHTEQKMWSNSLSDKPFILAAQQSLFDKTRAPEGKHTLWAYCHVPRGSEEDMTDRIINRIEYFAPGIREIILASNSINCRQIERYNPNMTDGDIMGGIQDWRQMFTRPVMKLNPYRMPIKGYYICSSSTPPGGGVHGMCGYHSALTALKDYYKQSQ